MIVLGIIVAIILIISVCFLIYNEGYGNGYADAVINERLKNGKTNLQN